MTVCRRLARESVPRYLALLGAMAMLLAFAPFTGVASADIEETPFPGDVGTVVTRSGDGLVPTLRFRGETRMNTAHLIAEEAFGAAAPITNALLARGDLFPDALAGNYLAGQVGGPILLTADPNILGTDAPDAFEALGVTHVIILGGNQAISPAVQAEIEASGMTTERLGGLDRYATASLIATRAGNTVGSLNGMPTAIVAFGDNFPDALVSGGIAYDRAFPLLLTNRDFLNPDTQATLEALEIEQVIIPGDVGVVSAEVVADLADNGITEVIRLAGPTRVDTAAEVAQFAIDELDFTRDAIGLARGNNFPDALTIGPRQGQAQNVVLLTVTESLLDSGDGVNEAFLTDSGCDLRRLDFAGGNAAITVPIEDEARAFATTDVACDVSLTPESATNPVGETHTVTVDTTNNGGEGIEGEEVIVTIEPETGSAALPTETSTVVVTDPDGTGEVDFTSPTPGDVVITACFTNDDGEEVCSIASKTFEADLAATLSGAQEIDPGTGLPNAGDLNANGQAYAIATDTGVCVGAVVEGLDNPALAAHIHEAPPGDNGPIVVDLTEGIRAGGNVVAFCATADEATRTDIATNPADYYVNIHNADFPGGAVRGQLAPHTTHVTAGV